MKLGSLFDGSGGFPLAGALNGVEPVWCSEVEPYPIAVTRSRFPNMKHYGDVSRVNGAEVEPVDIITFGSPCQDLSIAGKREGIEDGVRSSLFFQAVRIIKEMRETTDGKHPQFAVWENVPGAFSSNKGNDFRLVLEALASVSESEVSIPMPEKWQRAGEIVGDGWSIAWRTLDAQYWGVPQRRKRIYLVADFAGGSADEILFESQGVSRDFTPSGSPWKGTAGNAEAGPGTSSGGLICLNDQGGSVMSVTEDITAYGICSDKSNSMLSDNPHSGIYEAETSRTIDANGGNPLNTVDRHAIAYAMTTGSFAQVTEEKSPTLMSRDYKDPPLVNQPDYIVRRLTPTECARLQGFPDAWGELAPYDGDDAFWQGVYKTACEIKGSKYTQKKDLRKWYAGLRTDSAEYKMWGNGIALPCAEFVMRSIVLSYMQQ